MNIVANLNTVRQRIRQAEAKFHRQEGSVSLLAVSKTIGIPLIQKLIDAGQYDLGENYLQEALRKIEILNVPKLTWHFVGPIQSNKTRLIAQHFTWVHSVSKPIIAEFLHNFRPNHLPPLEVCIQVNLSNSPNKSGVTLEGLLTLAKTICQYENLKLRGLMTIPEPILSFDEQRAEFKKLRQAKESLQKEGFELDTLSMGMSHDLEAAIAEGATIVRVGAAIFGPRN